MKAVIFDMDGVIVDNSKWHKKAWEIYLANKGLKVEKEKIDKMYGMRSDEIIRMFFGDRFTDEQVKMMDEEKEALYRQIFSEAIKPTEGLIEYLKYLKEKQVRTAIATSACIENVDFTLDSLHIRDYFDLIVTGKDVKRGKPAPDIYLKAAEKLGLLPEECMVVEDAVAGVEAGKRAGCYVVAITTTYSRDELYRADCIIDDFHSPCIRKVL